MANDTWQIVASVIGALASPGAIRVFGRLVTTAWTDRQKAAMARIQGATSQAEFNRLLLAEFSETQKRSERNLARIEKLEFDLKTAVAARDSALAREQLLIDEVHELRTELAAVHEKLKAMAQAADPTTKAAAVP